MHYLSGGTKDRSKHFSTSGHVLFSWLKQHVFFLIERCCATTFPPLQVKRQVHEICRTPRAIASQSTSLLSPSEAKTSKRRLSNLCKADSPPLSVETTYATNYVRWPHSNTGPLALHSYMRNRTCLFYGSHIESLDLHGINVHFVKIRARCQPGFKRLAGQLPVIKRAHLPSSGRTA